MTDQIQKNPRKPFQKVSLTAAYISYFCGFVCLVLAAYNGATIGTENPIFASFAASIVFFVGAGIVLHVMGAVNLPNLSLDKDN